MTQRKLGEIGPRFRTSVAACITVLWPSVALSLPSASPAPTNVDPKPQVAPNVAPRSVPANSVPASPAPGEDVTTSEVAPATPVPVQPATQPAASASVTTPARRVEPAVTGAPTAGKVLTAEQKKKARQRFDRGLELYDAGDFDGALKEFLAALQFVRHPVVLYNVALVYARLGAPVECVRSVEELQHEGMLVLDETSRGKLLQVYGEQRSRIGRIRVQSNVPGAVIQIDGVDIAQQEVNDLPLAAGEHIVSTVASGYIPRRMRVVIPPEATEAVQFTLQPLQSTLAHLHLGSDVPDVNIAVDGEPVGQTPFPASLAFSPGTHQVVAQRPGYASVKRTIVLDPGGEGQISFEMQPQESADSAFSKLTIVASEPNSQVSLNGKPVAIGRSRIEVPSGRHRLKVHSAGFVDYERELLVAPGEQSVAVHLMPTSEFLGDYKSSAETQRVLGFVALGGGLAIAGAGGGFLVWNKGEQREAQRDYDTNAERVQALPGHRCDSPECADQVQTLAARIDSVHDRQVFGWIGVGVGAAAALTGTYLLIFGDDPERYDPRPESDVFGSLHLNLGPGQLSVTGRF
jgi:hypothetical protein